MKFLEDMSDDHRCKRSVIGSPIKMLTQIEKVVLIPSTFPLETRPCLSTIRLDIVLALPVHVGFQTPLHCDPEDNTPRPD